MQLIFNNKLLFKTGKTLQMANKLKKNAHFSDKTKFQALASIRQNTIYIKP